MKRRFSIWGREYGSDHDVELAQCDSNPEPVLKGFKEKTLTITHGIFENTKRRRTKVSKFTYLRIVENDTEDHVQS